MVDGNGGMCQAKLHGVKATQTDVKQPNYSLVSIRSDGKLKIPVDN